METLGGSRFLAHVLLAETVNGASWKSFAEVKGGASADAVTQKMMRMLCSHKKTHKRLVARGNEVEALVPESTTAAVTTFYRHLVPPHSSVFNYDLTLT